ncbi:MAG TPA: M48 family metalloprotease [Armatimonadota bacterium]|jgi:Zn-dependent protease with chaperone function
MARTVKRRKKTKAEPAAKFPDAELRFSGEIRQYWLAVVLVTWACVLVGGGGIYFTHAWQWIYLALWPLASIGVVNFLSNRPRVKQLKEIGPQCRATGTHHSEVYKILTDAAAVLEIPKLPVLCVVEDDAPYIYSMAGGKGTIIVTRALVEMLSRPELMVMVARELAHLKYGHIRLERSLSYVRNSPPALWILLLPLYIWGALMGEWLDIIDYTADRAALVVVGNPALVNATIVKVAAAADPQSSVTAAQIDEYITREKSQELDSGVMEQQFKLSRFVESQPNLRDRIEQVIEFFQSDEGKAVLDATAPARVKLWGATE